MPETPGGATLLICGATKYAGRRVPHGATLLTHWPLKYSRRISKKRSKQASDDAG